MFLNKYDKVGEQLQFGWFFNPVYMFVPFSKYSIVGGSVSFDVYALFGFRIALIQK